jgi:hypothetical protein
MLIGLGSAEGTVMAGKYWGAPMEVMPLPEAKPGTWEDVCRRASKVCVGHVCERVHVVAFFSHSNFDCSMS